MSIVFRFSWYKHLKPIASMLIGTSPELELALYTLCYLTRAREDCRVRLAGSQFSIKTAISRGGQLRSVFFDLDVV